MISLTLSGDNLWLCDQFGQRKAWHLIGVVCVLMSFPFIFSLCLVCDENTHQYAKLVYFSSFMLIFQFGWACSQISHLSAIPALAQNQNERTSLTAIRYSVTIMSQVMVYLTGMNLLVMKIILGNFQDLMSCFEGMTVFSKVFAISELLNLFSFKETWTFLVHWYLEAVKQRPFLKVSLSHCIRA